jgi:hypothetical protein
MKYLGNASDGYGLVTVADFSEWPHKGHKKTISKIYPWPFYHLKVIFLVEY